MIRPNAPNPSTMTAPKCPVCTTPARCKTVALGVKGSACAGRANGPDDCDCLNECGDDPWLETGRSIPCKARQQELAQKGAA